jgi:ATP-dependent DNA ligase
MDGNPFVIEQKFDGERIQVHKDGSEVRLFSRNSNNVTNLYGDKLIPIIQQHVLVSK